MLIYNEDEGIFEIPTTANEEYVSEWLNRDTAGWTKMQLEYILEYNLALGMSALFELYRYYPGHMIDFLEKLKQVNDIQRENREFRRELAETASTYQPLAFRSFVEAINNTSRICQGNIDFLGLEKFQSSNRITPNQMKFLKVFVDTYLQRIIADIKKSQLYKNALENGHLNDDIGEIKTLMTNSDDYIPSKNELEQEKAELSRQVAGLNNLLVAQISFCLLN